MNTSRTIAALMGPTLLAAVGAEFYNFGLWTSALEEPTPATYVLVFLVGLLSFVAGLAIVRVHNRWSGGWPVLVTVMGWLLVIGGLGRMYFTESQVALAAVLLQNSFFVIAMEVITLAVGLFLTFKGYSRDAKIRNDSSGTKAAA